jgi:hypothetical protein
MEVQRDSQQRADTSNSSEALTTIASKSKAEINIDLDQFYIEFEDKFRGSKQEIKQRLRAYLPYVDAFARVSDDQGRRFVDVGCGRVGSCNFYYDPTHRNPIVPAVAEFIARQRGFSKAEILRLHPFPEDYRVKGEGFSGDLINKFFFGAQDFALIAWK